LYARDMAEDHGYAFFIFRARDLLLLGGLTLSNVRRGVSQTASMGYWTGAPHTGHGYMTEAVRAMVPFAFEQLRLHRLEAACLPHNAASMRVLEKSGFRREGYAEKYLKIDGRWQDHVLYGLTEDDVRGAP
jgi:[ribosomal protein S5]-alanine N-acetyltransferase